jgi:hypothetical protein
LPRKNKELVIVCLLQKGAINAEEADLLREREGVPWGLVDLSKDLGLDPDGIIGYPARLCYCKGHGHPWEDLPIPGDAPSSTTRSCRCMSCHKYRHLVPNTGYGRGLWVWRYPRFELSKEVPYFLTTEDHRKNWDRLVEAVIKAEGSR